MPERNSMQPVRPQRAGGIRSRSALGIGVTTLVTIMVVLLLAAFAVLSLASSRSDLALSEKAVEQTKLYYAADSEATTWYAELDTFASRLIGEPDEYARQLSAAGYEVAEEAGELRVFRSFTLSEHRSLRVTITVNDDRTTTIRQWQS